MQFHGMTMDKNLLFSCNIDQAIRRNITDGCKWLEICVEIMEALPYLHEEAKLLRNNVTTSNILLTNSEIATSIHIVLMVISTNVVE